ncbi:MAG: putative methyltransferase [Gammaproteobacteria bacterium]|jgi:predicted methyltransferase
MFKPLTSLMVILMTVSTGYCFADSTAEAMAVRITAQLSAPGRDEYDAKKDPGRKPVETMQFFGVKEGMTVLDVIAGAGYNTEILSAAVGPTGTVYAQNTHFVVRLIGGAHHKAMLGRLADKRLTNVKYMVVDTEDMPFENSIDMAFWGMNMHDVYNSDGAAATVEFLTHIRRAMKPGAVLAIGDHVGIAGQDNAELHRIESAVMLDLLRKAGFEIEKTSDLLGNPDDDHTQSVYADGLRYNTDRLIVRARKPAQ